MSCRKFRREIEDATRGGALGADAEAHVAACGPCRAFLVERERLGALVASLARVEAPADFEFRLRARMARADDASRPRSWRGAFVPGAAWLTAAGCLVLALGLFVHFRMGATRERGGDTQGGAVARATGADRSRANQDVNQAAHRIADRVATQDETNASGKSVAGIPPSRTNDHSVSGRGPEVVEIKGATLAAANRSNATRRALRRERFVLPREAVEEIASVAPAQPRIESRSMAVTGAKIYTATPIPLPVASPDRKLEALFNDARGARRVVAVDPVAFGARGPAAKDASAKAVSYTGVW